MKTIQQLLAFEEKPTELEVSWYRCSEGDGIRLCIDIHGEPEVVETLHELSSEDNVQAFLAIASLLFQGEQHRIPMETHHDKHEQN